MNLQPPAALEFTESTEEKINLIRHCGSVSSVLSNDPAAAGEWVVTKKKSARRGKKHSTCWGSEASLGATSSRRRSTHVTRSIFDNPH
jgi:hypothetical protein